MKMKRMIAIAAIIIIVLVVVAVAMLYAIAQKPYVYPMTPEHAEWKEMMFQERCEACRIPQYKLWFMSTEHLLDSTLDHPLVTTLNGFDKPSHGIEHMRNVCDAYCMLIKRADAKDVILARYWKLAQDEDNIAHVLDSDLLRELLLYDPILVEQLTPEEKETLEAQPSLRPASADPTEAIPYDKEWRESILTDQ